MPDATTATAAAATTTAAATAAATTATAAAVPAWHGVPDTDAAGTEYVKNKGWTGVGDVIKSYQGAEKLIGRNPDTLLVMPRADDPEGLRAVLGKLGLPETADKYEFAKAPDGVAPDAGYEKFARDAFHKIGLLPGQVKELTTAHNAYVKNVIDQQEKDYTLGVQTDRTALLKEWGGGAERMLAAAKTSATALGFTQPVIDAMERAIGYSATMKFFSNLGQKLGEDRPTFGDKKGGFDGLMTPAEAKAEWEAIKADPVKVKALGDMNHPSHKALKEKQNSLFKIMHPEG